MTQKTILSLLLTLLCSVVTLAQTAPASPAKVNLIIDRETIRFAPQELALEMRLVVTDQSVACRFSAGYGTVAGSTFRPAQGPAVVLSTKIVMRRRK